MSVNFILKSIYHVVIKRDVLNRFELKKFSSVGNNSIIYKPKYIDRNKKQISIGNNTTILNGSRIQTYLNSSGIRGEIRIGNNCYFGYGLSLLGGADIVIEDGVLMASDIMISSENHSIDPEINDYYMNQPLHCKPVVIGEGTWIGEKVCVLPGVKIGKKCVIGAGSVVTKSIPDFSIAVGNPAKIIKKYNFEMHNWEKYKEE